MEKQVEGDEMTPTKVQRADAHVCKGNEQGGDPMTLRGIILTPNLHLL